MWGARFRAREWVARSWLIVPAAYVLIAGGLGVLVPDIGGVENGVVGKRLADDSARDVLSTVAGGMITFTGIVVAVAVVVVVFGAGQYTPRLVLRFRRDPVVKHALGIFVAPAIYALVALREVGQTDGFVPNLTVLVAIALLIVAVVAFVVLVARLLDLLRPRRLFSQLVRAGERAIDDVYPREAVAEAHAHPPLPEAGDVFVHEGREGVISALDARRLVAAAAAAGAVVELTVPIGGFVHGRTPLFRVRGATSAVDRRELERSILVAEERTITQDPSFAIRTIVDIAIRALSPAVNDPTTAVQAVDSLESLLHRLVARDLDVGRIEDDAGTLRVVHPVADWNELVGLALTELRRYGADAPQVARRLRSLLIGLLEGAPPLHRAAVEEQLALLDVALARAYDDPAELAVASAPDHLGLGGAAPNDGF
jgi:uncharacterized membrane protein